MSGVSSGTATLRAVHTIRASWWSGDVAILVYLATATLIVHVLTGGQYGFHRDELATLDDARHLEWGYVAYPPVTPFFGRLSLVLFGPSVVGFRFFASLASAAAIVLTGLMAWHMGGGRWAQRIAAAASIPIVSLISIVLAINIAIAGAVTLPIAPIHSKWWDFATKNNGDLVEEIGWPDLVQTIVRIRDELPDNERQHLGILTG